jgi:hypothetical protein
MNKTGKAFEKVSTYCKKIKHFVRKKRQTKLVKIKNKLALSANDHMAYDWIIDFNITQHMTFEREWFTTYESIVPRKMYMGEMTPFWRPLAKRASMS